MPDNTKASQQSCKALFILPAMWKQCLMYYFNYLKNYQSKCLVFFPQCCYFKLSAGVYIITLIFCWHCAILILHCSLYYSFQPLSCYMSEQVNWLCDWWWRIKVSVQVHGGCMSTLLSFNELWTWRLTVGEINWCKWLRRIYDSAPATEDGGVWWWWWRGVVSNFSRQVLSL